MKTGKAVYMRAHVHLQPEGLVACKGTNLVGSTMRYNVFVLYIVISGVNCADQIKYVLFLICGLSILLPLSH